MVVTFRFITTSEKIKYHFKEMSYSSIDVYGALPLLDVKVQQSKQNKNYTTYLAELLQYKLHVFGARFYVVSCCESQKLLILKQGSI